MSETHSLQFAGTSDAKLRLASTVMVMRQARVGLQVLLLRRNAQLAFAGGAWVFPGGAVDQTDSECDDNTGLEAEQLAARVAAVRECEEECGLILDSQQLVHFAHWTTPENLKRRFATWFFAAVVSEAESDVVIDDGEIHDFQWLTPSQGINRHQSGELDMMPPTYMSLKLLEQCASADQALECLRVFEPYWVTPRVARDADSAVLLYPGDAGYEVRDGALNGPRHRCIIGDHGVRYIHSGEDVGLAPMDNL